MGGKGKKEGRVHGRMEGGGERVERHKGELGGMCSNVRGVKVKSRVDINWK